MFMSVLEDRCPPSLDATRGPRAERSAANLTSEKKGLPLNFQQKNEQKLELDGVINHERHHRKGLTTCHIGIAEHDLRADGSGAPCGFGSGKADNRGIEDAANWNGGLENSVAQLMAMAMGRGANAGLVRPNHWRVWWRVFNGSNDGGGMMNAAEARGSASSPARRSGRGRLVAS